MSAEIDAEADFIIVGAGSAGCALANRLTANPANRVVLLEAGGDDRLLHNPSQFMANLNIRIPAGWTNILEHPQITWGYKCDMGPAYDGLKLRATRGKVLGGSSALNGLVYIRSLPSDYDAWRQLGCEGWGWSDVLPHFIRNEGVVGTAGEDQGTDGPLGVEGYPVHMPATQSFLAACAQAGLPNIATVNAHEQEGVCYIQQNTRGGARQSAAAAFLHPVRHRSNLRIVTGAQVTRLLFDGTRAVGIEYRIGSELREAGARREVILATGAIGSPLLLQYSGIGPAAQLAALGIQVRVANDGVGANLQDHLSLQTLWRLKRGTASYNAQSKGLRLMGQIARYAMAGRGVLAGGASAVTGFARSRPELDLPDFQLFASPASTNFAESARKGRVVLDDEPGFTLAGYQMRPQSRGWVKPLSPDPAVNPEIMLNALTADFDRITVVSILREMIRIMHQPAMSAIVEQRLHPAWDHVEDSDDALERHAKALATTSFHYCGTCAMGGEGSVVDPQLRVRGVDGLRIADASIIPTLPSGNINAACIMIGTKAAELILEER